MKNEFELAFNEVLEDKQLPKDVIMEALQAAMVSAYRRSKNASNAQQIEARIDPETGKVSIYAEKEVVEEVEDSRTEVALQDARMVDKDADIGSMVIVESTPKNFGRVAAQTARQVIQQRIREAERDSQFEYYSKQIGEIVSGVVQAVNAQGITLAMEMKAEGLMPRNQQISGERFRVHDRIRALLLEVKTSPRGPQIILSRAHRNFLRRLLENEVPEIYHGLVEIRSISREPGHRSKVAVAALQAGVDPVGACVGIRGVRIQAIVRELNDEKIDVIEWNADPAIYIAKSLSPARVAGVYLNELAREAKTATVVVPEDQLSLAIGRDGQNARLAAKLTSWRIDIKSLPEAASDALYKLSNDPNYAEIAITEKDNVPQVELILKKKDEGRPVTPEEYQLITQFVDRIERGIIQQFKAERKAEDEKVQFIKQKIHPAAFTIPLEDFKVSDRVFDVIGQAGFLTIGDLILQMKIDSDRILALRGMGPKGMKELEDAINNLTFPEVVEEVTSEDLVDEGIGEFVPEQIGISILEGSIEGIPSKITEEIPETVLEISAEKIEDHEEEKAPEEITGEPEIIDIVATPSEFEKQPAFDTIVEETASLEPLIEDKEQSTFEELFTLTPEVLDFEQFEDEESEDKTVSKKKKRKKKRFVEIEFDPDEETMMVKRSHKRTDQDWEENW